VTDTPQTIAALKACLPQQGRLEWIGLRPVKREAMRIVNEVEVITDRGLHGDHRMQRQPGGKRQVTLIQAEHLPVIAALSGYDDAPPEWLRRNLVVSGINLYALRDRQFYIGEVLFEGSGICAPCSRMEKTLGPGGYNAMRGHGGINAKVIQGGVICLGDAVRSAAVDD
jgi:MOSC domain-containing protein YiiM